MNYEPKFIVDFMCGRLAKWLRILGYDAKFSRDTSRNKILMDSLRENRIILTRDTRLSSKKAYKLILIRSDKVREQVSQVIKELHLKLDKNKFFSRCSICNVVVQSISKDSVRDCVPQYVYETNDEFFYCPECKRIYWQGSHYTLFVKEVEKNL
ncbi:MAG: Mut7-C RNAse domain-containing protein [Endomicrobia bacterium]|nr:Mut7-C RNAse domain-containing protein [Endomicrobiia bacterium]MCX7940524.1 Mut7-C RNAse domain-containing protein [Endomicrobiia bacterium]MDW8055334.1 Mut7-C RNAse domain-containing protein [Elusimicrobiota bacterium]